VCAAWNRNTAIAIQTPPENNRDMDRNHRDTNWSEWGITKIVRKSERTLRPPKTTMNVATIRMNLARCSNAALWWSANSYFPLGLGTRTFHTCEFGGFALQSFSSRER